MLALAPAPRPSPHHIPILRVATDDDSAPERTIRILVVEDDYLVGLEIEERLRQAGYRVVGVAGTVDEALALGGTQTPDLAVMDIRLSGPGDGVQAAIALFEQFGIRSIFATAHADQRMRERAKPANPLGWLQKPYSADALIAAIRAALTPRD